jgi:diguanylate cyclase
MDITIIGLTSPVALALVALLGYIVGHHQRRPQQQEPPSLLTLDETDALIDEIEGISNQLRQSMATHHVAVSRCREEIRVLSEHHASDPDDAHHMHLQAMLAPTDRLSHDIAQAYDELRQHTHALARLRTR